MNCQLADPVLDVLAFGCARQGASHRLTDPPLPCQDAYLITNGAVAGRSYLLSAVAAVTAVLSTTTATSARNWPCR